MFLIVQNGYRFFFVITVLCGRNIYKLLWIPVNQRKPAALYLHRNAMTF